MHELSADRRGSKDRTRIPAAPIPTPLFQQSVHFDFAASAKVHTSINDYWDHESRRHGGAIASAVLFRCVDRLIDAIRVERVEYCWLAGTVPCLGCDGPHNCALVTVCRN